VSGAVLHRRRVDLAERGYDVLVGAGAIAQLGALVGDRRRVAVVTQAAIDTAHGARVRACLDDAGVAHETFVMGDGEGAKHLSTVEELCGRFARWGLRRGDAVVAFGGGVVGDTAGFTAAVYYRGVDVVQVPTTLLAMVDAAIGGKTAVNIAEGKNLVGAFHQPIGVLAEPEVLATLPEREYRSGLGEVAKYALIGDDFVTGNAEALVARDPAALAEVVRRCVDVKADVVEADELERTGRRAVLNLGHTLAHALESAGGYGLLHGEAVAIGLVFAMRLAAALGRVDAGDVERAEGLVASLGLPAVAPSGCSAGDLVAIMERDKKSGGGLTFVLPGPNGIERVDDPPAEALRAAFAAVGVGR
jgi:3-dehydroquinate synthase